MRADGEHWCTTGTDTRGKEKGGGVKSSPNIFLFYAVGIVCIPIQTKIPGTRFPTVHVDVKSANVNVIPITTDPFHPSASPQRPQPGPLRKEISDESKHHLGRLISSGARDSEEKRGRRTRGGSGERFEGVRTRNLKISLIGANSLDHQPLLPHGPPASVSFLRSLSNTTMA